MLYTDGAVEAEDPAGTQFGLGRLAKSFAAAGNGPLATLPGIIVGDLTRHLAGRHNDDDVCLVAVKAEAAVSQTR